MPRSEKEQTGKLKQEVTQMNVPVFAEILRTAFDGFRGSSDELFYLLHERKDYCSLPNMPASGRVLNWAVKKIRPKTPQKVVAKKVIK
jgi:hypothetical protein